ncbi:MAG: AHH domain-containing protein, partial [Firmicutes bacterium]|nr:AHH domain-containing protein [Bacillota bacterium]
IVAGVAVSGLVVGGLIAGNRDGSGGFCWDTAADVAFWGATIATALISFFKVGKAVVAKIGQPKANKAKVGNTVAAMEVNQPVQPGQKHHFLTNKHSQFTPEFKKITDKYGLNLNESWNIEILPHKGRHAAEYHRFMLKSIQNIDRAASGNKAVFLARFDIVKNTVIQNPGMMYKAHWLALL